MKMSIFLQSFEGKLFSNYNFVHRQVISCGANGRGFWFCKDFLLCAPIWMVEKYKEEDPCGLENIGPQMTQEGPGEMEEESQWELQAYDALH